MSYVEPAILVPWRQVLSMRAAAIKQALDCLTPLGRGQTLLVAGEAGAGKSALVLDAILGQFRSGVRCVYAAIGVRLATTFLNTSVCASWLFWCALSSFLSGAGSLCCRNICSLPLGAALATDVGECSPD